MRYKVFFWSNRWGKCDKVLGYLGFEVFVWDFSFGLLNRGIRKWDF